MKLLIVALTPVLVTGCIKPEYYDRENWSISKLPIKVIHADPETGCEYIDKSSITPRIDRDGETHMGCGSVRAIGDTRGN